MQHSYALQAVGITEIHYIFLVFSGYRSILPESLSNQQDKQEKQCHHFSHH